MAPSVRTRFADDGLECPREIDVLRSGHPIVEAVDTPRDAFVTHAVDLDRTVGPFAPTRRTHSHPGASPALTSVGRLRHDDGLRIVRLVVIEIVDAGLLVVGGQCES